MGLTVGRWVDRKADQREDRWVDRKEGLTEGRWVDRKEGLTEGRWGGRRVDLRRAPERKWPEGSTGAWVGLRPRRRGLVWAGVRQRSRSLWASA